MKNMIVVHAIFLIQWCTFAYCCIQTVPPSDVTTILPTTTEETTEAPTTQTTEAPTTQTTEAPVTLAGMQI